MDKLYRDLERSATRGTYERKKMVLACKFVAKHTNFVTKQYMQIYSVLCKSVIGSTAKNLYLQGGNRDSSLHSVPFRMTQGCYVILRVHTKNCEKSSYDSIPRRGTI